MTRGLARLKSQNDSLSTRASDVSDPGDEDEEELEVLESALQELDEKPDIISEDDAKEILMTLIKNRFSTPPGKMGYKQVQHTKNQIKLDRGFRNTVSGGKGGGKKDIRYLKSITCCKACDGLGRWHKDAECPKGNGKGTSSSSFPVAGTKSAYMAMVEALGGEESENGKEIEDDDETQACEKLGLFTHLGRIAE